MTVVVDSSLVVSALAGRTAEAVWSSRVMRDHDLVAPHLLSVEVVSAVRKLLRAGVIESMTAGLALSDLADLVVQHHALGDLWVRVWELRENLTPYDAWYVALAETLEVPLATLDERLARAPGLRCEVWTPPDA